MKVFFKVVIFSTVLNFFHSLILKMKVELRANYTQKSYQESSKKLRVIFKIYIGYHCVILKKRHSAYFNQSVAVPKLASSRG